MCMCVGMGGARDGGQSLLIHFNRVQYFMATVVRQ